MAAARQKEIKDSITVVATTTFTVAVRCSDGTDIFSWITHTAATFKWAYEVS
jgi:hypothetical protein